MLSDRHHTTLPSGVRLVTTPQPALHGLCLVLAVRTGARDDAARVWGLTHFVEHMMFRGSAAFPTAAELIAPFEQAGGTLNAETWRDHTVFTSFIHPDHLEPVLHALGDMMAHPAFTEIEAERQLVAAELEAELDETGRDAEMTNISRAAIWARHPMGRRIVGSPATLAAFTEADVRGHHARHYVGANMVLSIAGRVEPNVAHTLAAKAFAQLPKGAQRPLGRAPKFCAGPARVRAQQGSQVALQLSFAALADGHPDFAALGLLVSLLDDGMGSRLHRALSERTGLVYAFQTGLDCYVDAGVYDLELTVGPGRIQAALSAACDVFAEVAAGAVTENELAFAKARTRMAMELGQDDAEDVAQEAAIDVLFGRPGPAQYLARVQATTAADITRLAQDMFLAAPYRMTLMGPTQGVRLAELDDRIKSLRARAASQPATSEAYAAAPSVLGQRRHVGSR